MQRENNGSSPWQHMKPCATMPTLSSPKGQSGSLNGLPPTRINQICTPVPSPRKPAMVTVPCSSTQGCERRQETETEEMHSQHWLGKKSLKSNKCVSMTAPCYPTRYPYLSVHPGEYGSGVGASPHSRLLGEEQDIKRWPGQWRSLEAGHGRKPCGQVRKEGPCKVASRAKPLGPSTKQESQTHSCLPRTGLTSIQ